MEKTEVLIIGGGASGLICAAKIESRSVIILERGDRVGRKLSATGNGQGNVTNENMSEEHYFSVSGNSKKRIGAMLSRFGKDDMLGFLEGLGGFFLPDSKGRIYPSGKQASAVTDLLRFTVAAQGKKIVTGAFVTDIRKSGNGYEITAKTEGGTARYYAQKVVLATGGMAAKNFGTDGNGFAIAKKLGHTVTDLFPSLVQIKTDVKHTKTLKGIRVNAAVAAISGGKEIGWAKGDVIFADYGVSGDAVFRLSAFITANKGGVTLSIDLLPEVSEEKLISLIQNKKKISLLPSTELLCGILNNQVGRAVLKRADLLDPTVIAKTVKRFTLPVTGNLGFDYAQVTKGGVPLSEVTDGLESKKSAGVYFTGEILDVDGECGGYNLQWAYTSASVVASTINQ